MPIYDRYPAINSNYNFPPEVNRAMSNSFEFLSKFYTKPEVDQVVQAHMDGIYTAYDVAVSQGFRGSLGEWLESLVGPEGPEGPYGGTEITDPQLLSLLSSSNTQTGNYLEQTYSKLENAPTATSETVEYFVSTEGSDDNDGLAEDSSFRTISKAVSMIPDIIRSEHVVTITLLPGSWSEFIRLENIFALGKLVIRGSTNIPSSHIVYGVRADTVIGHMVNENFQSRVTNGTQFSYSRCAPMVMVENVLGDDNSGQQNITSGSHGLLADYGSKVYVLGSEFNNRRHGIRSNYLSQVYSRGNHGVGNRYGESSRWGGVLSSVDSTVEGTSRGVSTDSGGIVGVGMGGTVGNLVYEPGLIEDLHALPERPLHKTYAIDSSVVGYSSDIESGDIIRLRYRARLGGLAKITVDYGGRPDSSTEESIKIENLFMVRADELRANHKYVITQQRLNENAVDVRYAGTPWEFIVDIKPTKSLGGWWSAFVELRHFRQQDGPVLLSADVIKG